MKKLVLALLVLAGFAVPAQAAFINIDDSNISTITITAGDFEFGFFVNGNLLTTGLGQSGSLTLSDGGYTISGSWIDPSQEGTSRLDLLFALPGNPTFTTSGIEFQRTATGGGVASLNGSFGGYIDPSLYFTTPLPTILQNGQTAFGGVPFLSVSFKSEVPVPEPTTMVLVGSALTGLALRRRRA